MDSGEYVTARPAGVLLARDYPTVTGVLQVTPSEFMGESFSVFTVIAKYEDGSEAPVEVEEESIEPANRRRSETTVLEV